jgi:hypothetical protein
MIANNNNNNKVYLRNISINALHKGDDDDDDKSKLNFLFMCTL